MNDRNQHLKRGDEIEVRFATHDNYIWHKAIVEHVDVDTIKARYASGHLKTIDRNGDGYRSPQVTPNG